MPASIQQNNKCSNDFSSHGNSSTDDQLKSIIEKIIKNLGTNILIVDGRNEQLDASTFKEHIVYSGSETPKVMYVIEYMHKPDENATTENPVMVITEDNSENNNKPTIIEVEQINIPNIQDIINQGNSQSGGEGTFVGAGHNETGAEGSFGSPNEGSFAGAHFSGGG